MTKTIPGKILIVDDEAIIRESLQQWLEIEGFRVLTAENGEKALQIIKTEQLDVAVFDIRMPGMDGITLLGHTRSVSPTLHVIMMTAFASIEDAVRCIEVGAYDYIIKPFPPEKLSKSIRHIIESLRLQQSQRTLQEERALLQEFLRHCSTWLALGTATAALSGAAWVAGPPLAGPAAGAAAGASQMPPLIDQALRLAQPALQRRTCDLHQAVRIALLLASPGQEEALALAPGAPENLTADLPLVPAVLGLRLLLDYLVQRGNLHPLLQLERGRGAGPVWTLRLQLPVALSTSEEQSLLQEGSPGEEGQDSLHWGALLLRHLGATCGTSRNPDGSGNIVLQFATPRHDAEERHAG